MKNAQTNTPLILSPNLDTKDLDDVTVLKKFVTFTRLPTRTIYISALGRDLHQHAIWTIETVSLSLEATTSGGEECSSTAVRPTVEPPLSFSLSHSLSLSLSLSLEPTLSLFLSLSLSLSRLNSSSICKFIFSGERSLSRGELPFYIFFIYMSSSSLQLWKNHIQRLDLT